MSQLIIAVDGPSGAGKSTVSKMLAARLGIVYIDTGAMYRAVALKSKEREVSADDKAALGELAQSSSITFDWQGGENHTFLDGRDVSEEIRTPDVTMLTSRVSSVPEVRAALLVMQRSMAIDRGVIMDGRDIGTVVFPDASFKFYLDANLEERGKRRHLELEEKGTLAGNLELTTEALSKRDRADSARKEAPLKRADDAIYIDTTEMDIDEVVSKMEAFISSKTVLTPEG